jgi:hypothetical protein
MVMGSMMSVCVFRGSRGQEVGVKMRVLIPGMVVMDGGNLWLDETKEPRGYEAEDESTGLSPLVIHGFFYARP